MKTKTLQFGAGLLTAALYTTLVTDAAASSHREAPLIAQDPTVDNTDLWAFTSPDAPNTVSIIAAYIGLEEPGGGPNFARFADNALYEIHIDNTGDGVPDLTYRFQFQTTYNTTGLANANQTFFYNVLPIDGLPTPTNFHNAVVAQTMNVSRIDHAGHATTAGTNVPTAPIYVGRFAYGADPMHPATTDAPYTAIANQAITMLTTGERVFAGPRDDPFFVDLGDVFDDVSIRSGLGNVGGGIDFLAGYNVHVIAIQIPIATIAPTCTTMATPQCVVGIYATASRPRVIVNHAHGNEGHGQMVQVSRLGLPLVNEVLIPLAQKDYWNTTNPWDDATNFGASILVPTLPTYAQALYGPTGARAALGYMAPTRSATDLSHNDMFNLVTGAGLVPGVPAAGTGFTPADELRLNVRTPPTTLPAAAGTTRLGAAGADGNGFPNGRRLFDDVVDIEERYVLNGLSNINAIPFGDGVDQNDMPFTNTFPYAPVPHAGSEPHAQRTEPAHP